MRLRVPVSARGDRSPRAASRQIRPRAGGPPLPVLGCQRTGRKRLWPLRPRATVSFCTTSVEQPTSSDRPGGLVQMEFHQPQPAGQLFLFLPRRRDQLKMLWRDGDGLATCYKRLHRCTFQLPHTACRPEACTARCHRAGRAARWNLFTDSPAATSLLGARLSHSNDASLHMRLSHDICSRRHRKAVRLVQPRYGAIGCA